MLKNERKGPGKFICEKFLEEQIHSFKSKFLLKWVGGSETGRVVSPENLPSKTSFSRF